MEKQASGYYAAVLVFESNSPAPNYQTLYEEEVVLLKAPSEETAKTKAMAYARAQEHGYKNCYDETITISLKLMLDIQCLQDEEIGESTSIYSRHFRDYAAYEAFEPLLSGQPL